MLPIGTKVVSTKYNKIIPRGTVGKVINCLGQIGLDNKNPPWTLWIEWINGRVKQEIYVDRGFGTGKYLATCKKQRTKNSPTES